MRGVFPSTLPAGRAEGRLALAAVLVSGSIFLGVVPFAKVQLAPVWPFIPIYQSALAINDLITAVLLLGQFSFLRSPALSVLAGGYLFTAFMAVAHMLTFPGLFAPTGLLYTAAMIIVVSSVWALSLLALGIVRWRRRHTVLDLWLMVVMCAWPFDIALAAVLNAGRFDLGFYAGRIYGLLAASFVLIVLLIENGRLYGQLVEAHDSERQERQRA